MSNTDSFINEVTEEVRRDRLFRYMRKYGWLAILIICAIVGGTAWSEWRSAQSREEAEALGDAITSALAQPESASRMRLLEEIEPERRGGSAIRDFLLAAEKVRDNDTSSAVSILDGIASAGSLPEIYRHIASFKALILQGDTLPIEGRRLSFERLWGSAGMLRFLAQEQLALLDIEEGKTQTAMERFQALIDDPAAGVILQQRSRQILTVLEGMNTDL